MSAGTAEGLYWVSRPVGPPAAEYRDDYGLAAVTHSVSKCKVL